MKTPTAQPQGFQLLWPRYRSRSKLAQMLLMKIKKETEEYDRVLKSVLGTAELR